MHRRGGNGALARAAERRAAKPGAKREPVLGRVRSDMPRVQARYDEIGDTIVREAVGEELDKWLHAAVERDLEAR